MPFWTLFLPSKLIWQLSVSLVAQVKNGACMLLKSIFCLYRYYHCTFHNSAPKLLEYFGVRAPCLLSFVLFKQNVLGDLHVLTVTVGSVRTCDCTS